jgi:hypothetical protein
MFGIEKDFQKLMEQVYGPLNKDKMTEKTNEPSGWNPVFEFPLDERDIIIIDGVKYKRVEEPQSFYDKLWGLLKTKLGDTCGCDDMADKVRDLIREHIPEPKIGPGLPEYSIGFNEAIRQVKMRLFNGIQ